MCISQTTHQRSTLSLYCAYFRIFGELIPIGHLAHILDALAWRSTMSASSDKPAYLGYAPSIYTSPLNGSAPVLSMMLTSKKRTLLFGSVPFIW